MWGWQGQTNNAAICAKSACYSLSLVVEYPPLTNEISLSGGPLKILNLAPTFRQLLSKNRWRLVNHKSLIKAKKGTSLN